MIITDPKGVFYIDSNEEVQHLLMGAQINSQILKFFTQGQLDRLIKDGRIKEENCEKSLDTFNNKKMPSSDNKSDKDMKSKKASGLE